MGSSRSLQRCALAKRLEEAIRELTEDFSEAGYFDGWEKGVAWHVCNMHARYVTHAQINALQEFGA